MAVYFEDGFLVVTFAKDFFFFPACNQLCIHL